MASLSSINKTDGAFTFADSKTWWNGQGSGAALGGAQAQPATSPSPAPAAGAPSASAAGSGQAVPLVSTPRGKALGVPAYGVRDQVFAYRVGTQSVALAPPADPPWTW